MNFPRLPAIGSLVALLLITSSVFAQSFKISPANPVLSGEKMSIVLTGAPPNAEVKIATERAVAGWGPNAKRLMYRAEATFAVNEKGEIDLAVLAPKANSNSSYKGADIRGLFWSMMPTKTEASADAKEGNVSVTASTDGKQIATTTIEFVKQAPDLKIENLEKFPGAIFANLTMKSGSTEKRPGLIVMGGSEGGSEIVNDAAVRLASRGFAVMSLPYYSPAQWPSMKQEIPALPKNFADIPLERINEARDYLRSRAEVESERIGIYGVSKGAEFVLLAATNFPWVKSAVAVVPTDVVWEGWGDDVKPGMRSSFSLNGKPFPFTPYKDFGQEFTGFQTGDPVYIRRPQDRGRAANPAAAVAARIPVERYKGPLLIIGGQDDQVWSSGMMSHNIAERRAEAKVETVSLIYSDAGHYLSGNGWSPTTQYNAGPSKSGGTPAGNAAAQGEAWVKTIEFLQRTLGAGTKK
jgi:dienelactone hydrolase